MRLTAMPSSVIRAFDYDRSTRRLDIQFVSGRRYSYHEVPPQVARALDSAPSKGSFFNRRVRDHYAFTKLR
jgi:hypothetical protein